MIVVNCKKKKNFKSVDWIIVKHPVVVEHTNGNVYLTVPVSEFEKDKYYSYERDCICLISYNTEKVGNKVHKLNLDYCQLYNEEITIINSKDR